MLMAGSFQLSRKVFSGFNGFIGSQIVRWGYVPLFAPSYFQTLAICGGSFVFALVSLDLKFSRVTGFSGPKLELGPPRVRVKNLGSGPTTLIKILLSKLDFKTLTLCGRSFVFVLLSSDLKFSRVTGFLGAETEVWAPKGQS